MQTWYLIIGIGALLLVTTIVNNIAEAVERKAREKKLRILRLKRSVDNLSEFLDNFRNNDLPKEIQTLLQNEIFSRLVKIQQIDKSFNGIAELIEEAKAEKEEHNEQKEIDDLSNITETELMLKLAQLRQLTKYLQQIPFYAKESLKSKIDYHDILIVYRFEKLNHFYSKAARHALQNNNYDLAKQHMDQISGAITLAGHSSPRLKEINDQAILMTNEIKQQEKQFILQQQQELAKAQEQEQAEKDEEDRRG